MEKGVLWVQILNPNSKLPHTSDGRAGYTLFSIDEVVLLAGQSTVIDTGISIIAPPGCYGRLASLFQLSNQFRIEVGAGALDPSYRGNVYVVLYNFGKSPVIIRKGDPVAELIIEKFEKPKVQQYYI